MRASRLTTGLLAALILCCVVPLEARIARGKQQVACRLDVQTTVTAHRAGARYLLDDPTGNSSNSTSNAKGTPPNATAIAGQSPSSTPALATSAVAARLSPNEQEQLTLRDTSHSAYANELIASGDRENSFCWFCAAAGAGDQAARGMWDLCQSMVRNERSWWLDRERRRVIDSGALRPNKVAAAANLPPATTDVTTLASANIKPAGNAKPRNPDNSAPAASPRARGNRTRDIPKFQAASVDCQSVSEQFSDATDALVADYLTQEVMGWDASVNVRRRTTKAVLEVARSLQELFSQLVEPHLPASPCGDASDTLPEDYSEEGAGGDVQAQEPQADPTPAPADAAPSDSPAPGNGTAPADGTPGRK